MPEITILYQNQKTLAALKDFAKYLDFKIMKPKNTVIESKINQNKNMVLGDSSIDISELSNIFSTKGIDAKKIRTEAWHRK